MVGCVTEMAKSAPPPEAPAPQAFGREPGLPAHPPPPETPAREALGWHLVLDLYGCRLDRMTGRDALAAFVRELCDDVLGMKRFGEPIIEHFGHANPKTDGYSLVQLIETSSVVAHFSEERRSAYVDIFSCVQ